MKSLEEQIKFLDIELLPVYGFKAINDYNTKLNTTSIENINNFLEKLNKLIPTFRKIFPVKDFSLHKTEYQIKTHEQALLFLKKCLTVASIPFEFNKKNLRLISQNNILDKYIQMSEIRTNIPKYVISEMPMDAFTKMPMNTFTSNESQNSVIAPPKEILVTENELIKAVKNTEKETYYVPLNKVISRWSTDGTKFFITLRSDSLQFIKNDTLSLKLSLDSIESNKLLNGCKYKLYAGGTPIYENILDVNKNIYPNSEQTPILFSMGKYHDINIEIAIPNELVEQKNNIIMLVEQITPVYYKPFEETISDDNSKLNGSMKFDIRWGDNNLIIFTGLIGVPKAVIVDERPKSIFEYGKEDKLFDFKYFKLFDDKTTTNDALQPLISGYDVSGLQVKQIMEFDSYYKKNKNYIAEYIIKRGSDSISELILSYSKNSNIIINQINIAYGEKVYKLNYELITTTNDIQYKITFPDALHLNLIYLIWHSLKLVIYFDETSNINNIMDVHANPSQSWKGLKLDYMSYFFDSLYRRQMAVIGNMFININDLYNSVNKK
jgi:hypothetical protein